MFLVFNVSQAQDKPQDTLKTDVVNVVKPYQPTLSDAFKVKQVPNLADTITTTKMPVAYTIKSLPVASTYTPAKGKAAVVEKAAEEHIFSNYANVAVGSYTSILGDVYLNHQLSRSERVGANLNHHSSGGGIDGVLLDDDFIDSKWALFYNKQNRDLSWNLEGGYQLQAYNWYGLEPTIFAASDLSDIDPKHTFHGVHLKGDIAFDRAVVEDASVLFRRFSDDRGSGENHFLAQSNLMLIIDQHELSVLAKVDYLGGAFDQGGQDGGALNYSNIQVGLSPSYQLSGDDWAVDFGLTAYYFNDLEYTESKFFVYPNIRASYELMGEVATVYAGITGGLVQNTYHNIVQENPFVSPDLLIAPTDQRLNGFLGLRGKLSNILSYDLQGRYFSEKNKPLFRNNLIRNYSLNDDYDYGNSFGVVYDLVNTLQISGTFDIDINRKFSMAIKAEYFAYDVDAQQEAWNLPDFKGVLTMDYKIDQHWFTGASLFYTGERKDLIGYQGSFIPQEPAIVTLDAFMDANAHLGYNITQQLCVFVRGRNLFDQNYQRFVNYPVQGIQILAGAGYKFNF